MGTVPSVKMADGKDGVRLSVLESIAARGSGRRRTQPPPPPIKKLGLEMAELLDAIYAVLRAHGQPLTVDAIYMRLNKRRYTKARVKSLLYHASYKNRFTRGETEEGLLVFWPNEEGIQEGNDHGESE